MPPLVLKSVVVVAGLVLSSMAIAASPPSKCPKPHYPELSRQLEQEGITVLGFRMRADGTVSDTAILHSSGFAALDQSAQNRVAGCVFDAGTGEWAGIWMRVSFKWFVGDTLRKGHTERKIKRAAEKGDPAARYHLSLILSDVGASDADRQRAIELLLGAAEAGYATAQYDLGRRYEKGADVTANLEEALRWYEKAAAQGDVLAVQRLESGKLFD